MANLSVHLLLIIAAIVLRMEARASGGSMSKRAVVRRFQPRIYNGQNADIAQFPYQAHIEIHTDCSSHSPIFNGGSLIGCQWVLTTAYFTAGATEITVYLGTIDISSPETVVRGVEAIRYHPEYNPLNYIRYAVALMKLDEMVDFTSAIRPIRLPSVNSGDFLGENVIASGWGSHSEDGTKISPYLQYAPLEVISSENCEGIFDDELLEVTLCAEGCRGASICH